jgi:hypothetical protein
VSNVLNEEKRQQVIALGRLGWPLRRIEEETGVRRETAGAYLKAAGIAVRPPRSWGRRPPAKPANRVPPDPPAISKPANEVPPDSGSPPKPGRSPTASACEPYCDFIEVSLGKGRNAKAIYHDLVDDHGFRGAYQSVKRFVRGLHGTTTQQACAVIVTPPGEEAQVDYGTGPMVRDPHSGRYRRTRMFVLTLGYSRKSVRLLAFQSSARVWAELHEQAFRRLGGVTRTVVLDNLGEGVLNRTSATRRSTRSAATCSRTTVPSLCLAAYATPIARARSGAVWATPKTRRSRACVLRASKKPKPTSTAGRRTGPTHAFMAPPGAR